MTSSTSVEGSLSAKFQLDWTKKNSHFSLFKALFLENYHFLANQILPHCTLMSNEQLWTDNFFL